MDCLSNQFLAGSRFTRNEHGRRSGRHVACKAYRMLEACSLQTNLDRTRFPPWGTQGGKEGRPGRFTLIGADDAERSIEKEKGFRLNVGDRVRIETGGGGGYGPPVERSIELVQRDLDAGYISAEAARRDYDVTVGVDGTVARRG